MKRALKHVVVVVGVVGTLSALAACGDEDSTSCGAGGSAGSGGTDGAGGSTGGAGGSTGGTGGSTGGAGGSTGGTGGSTGGAGGSTGGSGGSKCGNPTGGPAMVEVADGYCIDATEVTRSQYASWLSTNPSTSGQPSYCSWNTDYTPDCEWPADTKGDHPVLCVDWCDAYAYCQGVGKRLCGKIGGGANAFGDSNDATKSQWYNACTSGGQNAYPYGNVFIGQACNEAPYGGISEAVATGSLNTCQSSSSGFAGVYDLSGNAGEWEDSCSGNTDESDTCRVRGGSFFFDNGWGHLRCDSELDDVRGTESDYIGFRCCAP